MSIIPAGKTVEQMESEHIAYLKQRVAQDKQAFEDNSAKLLAWNSPADPNSIQSANIARSEEPLVSQAQIDLSSDPIRTAEICLRNLKKIVPPDVAEYVASRLDNTLQTLFNANFNSFVKEHGTSLKANGITKDGLIALIRTDMSKHNQVDALKATVQESAKIEDEHVKQKNMKNISAKISSFLKDKKASQAKIDKGKLPQDAPQDVSIELRLQDLIKSKSDREEEVMKLHNDNTLKKKDLIAEYGKMGIKLPDIYSTNRNKTRANITDWVMDAIDKNAELERENIIRQQQIEGVGVKRKKLAKPVTRKPMPHRRFIVGGGSPETVANTKQFRYKLLNSKFLLDLNKFDDLLLSVKYEKNNQFVHNLHNVKISTDCKDIIQDIIENKFNNKAYNLLLEVDRRTVRNFVKACHFDIKLVDKDQDRNQKEYELLMAQVDAGNNSPTIISKLKKYILLALSERRISQRDALNHLIMLGDI